MSRTKRRDPIDHYRPVRFIASHGLGEIDTTPTAKDLRKAHSDKKKNKPGRRAKEYLNKGVKASAKLAVRRLTEDPDGTPLPVERKSHLWNWL